MKKTTPPMCVCAIRQNIRQLSHARLKRQCFVILLVAMVISSSRIVETTTINTSKKCRSDFDCLTQPVESCCVAITRIVGICKPKTPLFGKCYLRSTKFVILWNGGFARNMCGCQRGLVCKTVERKKWWLKKLRWSKEKWKVKGRFKDRCRRVPREATEYQEFTG